MSESTLTRYLLGGLSEAEQTAVEERYFTDLHAFDELVETENELVDSYVRGRLSAELRERFEQHYLASPRRRERVEFARALMTRLDRMEGHQAGAQGAADPNPWWRRRRLGSSAQNLTLALAASLVFAILGGAWFWLRSERLQRELAGAQIARSAQTERERALEAQLAAELSRVKALNDAAASPAAPQASAAPAFATLLLNVGGTREADTGPAPTLLIPAGAGQVRIRVHLTAADYPKYRAVLRGINGDPVFTRQTLEPTTATQGADVVLTVPAGSFATGDYILTLSGVRPDAEVDDVSRSIFHVDRRRE